MCSNWALSVKSALIFILLILVICQATLLHTDMDYIESLKDERDAAIQRADVTLKSFKSASEDEAIYQIYIKPLCYRKSREAITLHKGKGEM